MVKESNYYPAYVPIPIMEKKRFAELTGFSEGVIDGWIDRLLIPSLKIGKHRVVNLALVSKSCLEGLPLNEDI